jgi:hypothetical protein
MTVEFGDVVETRYVTSEEQLKRSQFGFSPVSFSGSPIVYTPGDVVHLPYASGELSTLEAVGLAWGAFCEWCGAQYLGSHQPKDDHLVLTKQHWLDSGSRYPRQFAQGLTHFCHIPAIGVTRERVVECCVVRTQAQDTVITHLE